MKASQLESMKQIQEEIERERLNSCNLIKDKEAYLPKLEEELFEWEDKYKKSQSSEKLRTKQSELMAEASWASVIETEKKIDMLTKDLKTLEKSKEKLDEKFKQSSDAYQKAKEHYESIKSNIDTIKKVSTDMNLKKDNVAKAFKAEQQNYKTVQNDIKQWNRYISQKESEKKKLNDKIEEEKRKNQNDINEQKANHEKKIQQCKQKQIDLEHLDNTKKNELNMFKMSLEKDNKQLSELGYKLNSREREINKLRDDVRDLNASKNEQILRFGPRMLDLCNDIKQMFENKKFKQMPLGPLGMYVEVKDYKWALAIEECVGPMLTAFLCGSFEDERVLQSVIARYIKEVHNRPRIIVTDFNTPLYDVSSYVSSMMLH